ncbi:hypothetical protein A4A49_33716 [Nicotiana attenuata]|uniref:Uncharacterized protein n=1 Tax=Nicotiana attenuata TaxID=49451 RepID=A0A1J6I9K4_NICAT|nr:hypothetical protein A4A49_33716 [Nicotiana attenuata]
MSGEQLNDTRVDNNLAKKQKKGARAESGASDDLFTSTEKVKWTRGRFWEDQIEEDSEVGDIPDGMQNEIDSDVDIEEEEQSVYGEANINKEEELINKVQEDPKTADENKEGRGDADNANNETGIPIAETGDPSTTAINPKDINVNMGDPGGTGKPTVIPEVINMNTRESARSGNKQKVRDQVNVEMINYVPLDNSQIRRQQPREKAIFSTVQARELDTDVIQDKGAGQSAAPFKQQQKFF